MMDYIFEISQSVEIAEREREREREREEGKRLG